MYINLSSYTKEDFNQEDLQFHVPGCHHTNKVLRKIIEMNSTAPENFEIMSEMFELASELRGRNIPKVIIPNEISGTKRSSLIKAFVLRGLIPCIVRNSEDENGQKSLSIVVWNSRAKQFVNTKDNSIINKMDDLDTKRESLKNEIERLKGTLSDGIVVSY